MIFYSVFKKGDIHMHAYVRINKKQKPALIFKAC